MFKKIKELEKQMIVDEQSIKQEDLKKIEEAYKPYLLLPIVNSFISIAPFLHLILSIVEGKYEVLLVAAFLSAVGIAFMTFLWSGYYYRYVMYKDELLRYKMDPEHYNW